MYDLANKDTIMIPYPMRFRVTFPTGKTLNFYSHDRAMLKSTLRNIGITKFTAKKIPLRKM